MLLDPTIPESQVDTIDKIRRDMLSVSYYKYGPAKDNCNGRVDVIGCIDKCLKKYKETHNTEYLLDVMNYVMFRYCGECPVWLAAFEKESDIQTDEDLHKACQYMVLQGKCDCYGELVSFDELGDNYVMKNLYNRLAGEKGSE